METVSQCDEQAIKIDCGGERRLVGFVLLFWSALLLVISLAPGWPEASSPQGLGASFVCLLLFLVLRTFQRRQPHQIILSPSTGEYQILGDRRTLGAGKLEEFGAVEMVPEPFGGGSRAWSVVLRNADPSRSDFTLVTNRTAESAREWAAAFGEKLNLPITFADPLPDLPSSAHPTALPAGTSHALPTASEDVLAREMEEMAKRAASRPFSWSRMWSVDHILRSDEAELQIGRHPRSRWTAQALLGGSALLYVLADALRFSFSASPSARELSTFVAEILSLSAWAGGLSAISALRPHWSKIRRGERLARVASGWLARCRLPFDSVEWVVVERLQRKWSGGGWTISLRSANRSLPIAKAESGRDARIIVEAVSLRLGVPILDRTGALPPLLETEGLPSASPSSAHLEDTPEQRAARAQLDEIDRVQGASVVRWRNATIASSLIGTLFALARTGLQNYATPPDMGDWLLSLAPFVVLQVISLAGWYGAQGRLGSEYGKVDSVAAVGPLLDLVAESSGSRTSGVKRALTNLLRRLKPADGRTLSERQRQALRSLLTMGKARQAVDGDTLTLKLKSSALAGLEQIGNEQDIPVVESLLVGADGELRQDIANCLEALYHRGHSDRSGSTLLRAYTASPDESLLRPAQSDRSSDPELLLRTADADPAALCEVAVEYRSSTDVTAEQELRA